MPTKHRTLTIEMTPQLESALNALNDRVPLATRHGLAKAALFVGLQELSNRPSASVIDELVALRQKKP